MKKFFILFFHFMFIIISCCFTNIGFAQLAVFPGAEGFGTGTVAGRGGAIYRVNTLEDHTNPPTLNGDGTYSSSLRAAVNASGPRTIVFEVGGVITLGSMLRISNPYITIAGQTAPGQGIMLRNYGVSVRTSNVLIQHITIRPGDEGPDGYDTLDAMQILSPSQNVVIDHCSLSWAIDENADTWTDVRDVTFSNCIISEGLRYSRHSDGKHSKGYLAGRRNINISFIKNLMAHNEDRNPLIYGMSQVFVANNIFYNSGGGFAAVSDGWFDGPPKVSIVGNIFKTGLNGIGRVKEYSFDGNPATRWQNDETIENAWIKYDLGSSKTVEEVKLLFYVGSARTYPIKIEVGDSTLTTVWEGDSSLDSNWQRFNFNGATGRYVKISMTAENSKPGKVFGINETEIWGSTGSEPVQHKILSATAGSEYIEFSAIGISGCPEGTEVYEAFNFFSGHNIRGGQTQYYVDTSPVQLNGFTYATTEAEILNHVLTTAGSRPAARDAVDERIANPVTGEVVTGTGKWVDTVEGAYHNPKGPYTHAQGGWPSYPAISQVFNVGPNLNGDDNSNGYTNLEELLHQAAAAVESGGSTLISNMVVDDTENEEDWSIQKNIQLGDLQYGDGDFTFTSIPSSVAGCDWIRTANDSKVFSGSPLVAFTVNASVEVYVAHNDLITAKPPWMSGWTDTGEDIVNNEYTPGTFSLYKKDFAPGSQVSLGNNGSTSPTLYTIIVKEALGTGIEDQFNSPPDFSVYPNPFGGYVNIDNADRLFRVIITNVVGQCVKDIVDPTSVVQLDDLTRGVYFMTLISKEGVVAATVRIIK